MYFNLFFTHFMPRYLSLPLKTSENLGFLCFQGVQKDISGMKWVASIYLYIPSKYYRSSLQRCSIRKGALRNFAKFTGKHLCQSLFFNKVAGLRPATLLKKRHWNSCFPVNFLKFLRTPFLQNTSGRLLLILQNSGRKTFTWQLLELQ